MQKAQDAEGDPKAVAEAELRVKKLQSGRWDEVKLTIVLPKEEEDKLKLQLEEKPDDEAPQKFVDDQAPGAGGFKQVTHF